MRKPLDYIGAKRQKHLRVLVLVPFSVAAIFGLSFCGASVLPNLSIELRCDEVEGGRISIDSYIAGGDASFMPDATSPVCLLEALGGEAPYKKTLMVGGEVVPSTISLSTNEPIFILPPKPPGSFDVSFSVRDSKGLSAKGNEDYSWEWGQIGETKGVDLDFDAEILGKSTNTPDLFRVEYAFSLNVSPLVLHQLIYPNEVLEDDYTLSLDFGDGQIFSGTFSKEGTYSVRHDYQKRGVYEATLSFESKKYKRAKTSKLVVGAGANNDLVYDPNLVGKEIPLAKVDLPERHYESVTDDSFELRVRNQKTLTNAEVVKESNTSYMVLLDHIVYPPPELGGELKRNLVQLNLLDVPTSVVAGDEVGVRLLEYESEDFTKAYSVKVRVLTAKDGVVQNLSKTPFKEFFGEQFNLKVPFVTSLDEEIVLEVLVSFDFVDLELPMRWVYKGVL